MENDDWLQIPKQYFGESILDHRLISERYFFPRENSFKNPRIIKNGNISLSCYYRGFPGAEKTIIYFHGNGETVKEYLDSPLLKLPYNILFAEYRGYGISNGDPSLVAMLNDVRIIIESINQPKENIILFGRSIGSIYAIHGASLYHNSIGGLIIESGIADVRERILMRVTPKEIEVANEQFDTECHKYFDHESKISSFKGKTLIMHTQHDMLVDVSNAKKLYEWANQPKKLVLFEDGGHNSILDLNTQEYLDTVQMFIDDV